MNFRRILGAAAVIIGIALLFVSHMINTRLNEGEEEISSAKENISRGDKLFSLNPVSKEVGKVVTHSADKKIEQGEETIRQYTLVANGCYYGGIALIVLGVVVFIFGRKKRK
jgi:hypothetical protein